MKYISILGSTGSIGRQTLEVISCNKDKFTVVALVANSNIKLLEEQIDRYSPELAVVVDEVAGDMLKKKYNGATKILTGQEGLIQAAVYDKADIVVTSLVGFAGLKPTIAAIKAKKDIALANKETLVAAGELVMNLAKENNVKILPVDSEHSAIFQCLQGEESSKIEKIILTASGGPFRGKTVAELKNVTLEQCLKHPNWSMGQKISVDSATMMNKALEVIEAHYLFGMSAQQMDVVIHPQSIVHSMVQYRDSSIVAQMGTPDMRVPIAYGLSWPERIASGAAALDFANMGSMTFESVQHHGHPERFPCMALVWQVLAAPAGTTVVFNAANEVAVNAFLKRQIRFDQIYQINAQTLQHTQFTSPKTLEDLMELDALARSQAQSLLQRLQIC